MGPGTHRQIGMLTGHTGEVNSVAFAPDGGTLASAGADQSVRLWDTATHRRIGEPGIHAGDAQGLAF